MRIIRADNLIIADDDRGKSYRGSGIAEFGLATRSEVSSDSMLQRQPRALAERVN